MSQTTKFFLVLGFLWIIFTTLKGTLANYLQLIFAECNGSGSNTVTPAPTPVTNNSAADNLANALGVPTVTQSNSNPISTNNSSVYQYFALLPAG